MATALTGAVQIVVDTWPELCFAAVVAAGLVVLSRRLTSRLVVRLEKNHDAGDPHDEDDS